jgi:hypothetical protein
MPTVSTPTALPSHIEELLSTRESHVEAIAVIDATLARVTAALGGSVTAVTKPAAAAPAAKPKRGRPAGPRPAAPMAAAGKPAAEKSPTTALKKRGAVSKFGVSANDFVLGFIGASKNGATTQEINNHWKTSSRPGNADNSLSVLTKAKKLKRVKMPKVPGGPRGSRYTLA